MSWLDGWRHRFTVMRGRDRYQREVHEELGFHLATDVIHEHAGQSDAGERASRRFGNVTYTGEEVRLMTGYAWWDSLQQDARFAVRGIRRNPVFAAIVAVVLALGIGANTAIFSFLDNVVLRPLPYPTSGQLVLLQSQLIGAHEEASYPDFLDWRARNHTLTSVSGYVNAADNFAPPGEEPERLRSARITSDFLGTLGIVPALGRGFTPADQVFGAHHVVIISDALWRSRFNHDPGVIGRTIILNTIPYAIVGVAPAALQVPVRAQLWAPLAFDPAQGPLGRRSDFVGVIGRMKPGVTLAAAQRDLSAVGRQLAQEYPGTNGTVGVLVQSLHDVTVGAAGPAFLLLAGAVGLVLLIACANVANLLLARGATRGRELAVRVALGAGRARLLRQLLTESVLLAAVGGVLGLVVAVLSVGTLKTMLPADVPRLDTVHIDAVVLGFSAALSSATGLLFGIAPALRMSRDALAQTMNEGDRGNTGARAERLRGGLVLAQTALALVLLSGAGLMVHSLMQLRDVQLGFRPEGLLAARVVMPQAKYATPAAQSSFVTAFDERLRTLPGVRRVGLTTDIPLGGGYDYLSISIAGRPAAGPTERGPDIIPTAADSAYFDTMGMTLIAGRMFGEHDDAGAPAVAVVNDETVRRYFAGRSPIGERITMDSVTWLTIIGVVRSTKLDGVAQETYPQLFAPLAQNPQRAIYVVIRTDADPLALVPSVRRELAAIDPAQPLTDIESMSSRVADSLGPVRLQSVLLSVFSALALILAALGIYGVVAYGVAQRRREIGIRMALGARAASVRQLVLRTGMRPVLVGAAVGVIGSVGLARLIRGMTYHVGAIDPLTLGAATFVLVAVSVAACVVPAQRATRVPPTEALRGD